MNVYFSKSLVLLMSSLTSLVALLACQAGEAPAQSTPLPSAQTSAQATAQAEAYIWKMPEGFPKPKIPADNPMTIAKVDLGRHLFYDKRLSLDQSQSCASCHLQSKAFSDGLRVPTGVTGVAHPRNSMALFNLAYNPTLTWNNHQLTQLETQMLLPLFGETPPEMAMTGLENELFKRLREQPLYQQKFKAAFPQDQDPFTLLRLTQALASFERSMISANSAYDRYVYAEDDSAISLSAKRGEALFFSETTECFHCHGGFNFTDSSSHTGNAFTERPFHNTGLYNLGGTGAYPADNTGLYELTHLPEDMGRFRAPSLRNIELTAPYMHDGSIATLEDVIEHYAAGGRTIRSGPYAGVGSTNPYKSGFVKGFKLTEQEKADLIAFLKSLTDHSFIQDPALSDPFAQSLK